MQRPDEHKRRQIVETATRLFADRPFHEVRLEDVAGAARIGKGTVYIYFKSKEELFLALAAEGFEELLARVRRAAEADGDSWRKLEGIVGELSGFTSTHPHFYRLIRAVAPNLEGSGLLERRREMSDLIERVIRAGVRKAEMHDPRPDLTAHFILAMVRGGMVHAQGTTPGEIAAHVLRVLRGALAGRVHRGGPRGPTGQARRRRPARKPKVRA